jgi:hypothetical protein
MIRRPGTSVVKASKSPPAGIAGAAIRRMKGNGQGDSFTGSFFPPGSPLPTQAPRSVAGRRFDYPQGVNLTYTPRQQSGQENVTFDLLRRFAEPTRGGLDIVRLLIERRKKQMKAQNFKIVGREKDDDGGQRARDIEAMFRKPDGTHSWRGWLSGVLEDHFVIDAVAIYPRWSGTRPVFDQIDGALIDLLVDDGGRRPVPPLPAYQQILKGLPAVNYTTDELAYFIENPRPQKIYGFSPVEQMIGIITIALNRQLSILNYFTSGSVPDMLVGVPETWNPDQISQFQEWWDSVLAGQLGERRHARFIPGGTKPIETKEKVLMGEFDEWIARVACFCFGISPQAFVKEMNRATAETSKSSAAEEGLEPTKMFVKDVVDDLLTRCGADDLQLAWQDEEVQDPKTKAEIAVMLRGGTTGSAKPVITLEEQREMMGLKPPTADQIDELDPPPPDPMVGPDGKPMAGGLPPGGPVKTVPAPDAVKKAAASRGGGLFPRSKRIASSPSA